MCSHTGPVSCGHSRLMMRDSVTYIRRARRQSDESHRIGMLAGQGAEHRLTSCPAWSVDTSMPSSRMAHALRTDLNEASSLTYHARTGSDSIHSPVHRMLVAPVPAGNPLCLGCYASHSKGIAWQCTARRPWVPRWHRSTVRSAQHWDDSSNTLRPLACCRDNVCGCCSLHVSVMCMLESGYAVSFHAVDMIALQVHVLGVRGHRQDGRQTRSSDILPEQLRWDATIRTWAAPQRCRV